MLVDIADERMRATIRLVGADRLKLTIEYPRDPVYRDRVNSALADLLRPSTHNDPEDGK